MVSENVVELFGKDTLFFNIYFNQDPSENVATSHVANQLKIYFNFYINLSYSYCQFIEVLAGDLSKAIIEEAGLLFNK